MNVEKYNICDQNNNELGLIVFNNEFLYSMRRNIAALKLELDELYTYSDVQFNYLKNMIARDLGEV